MYRQLEKSPALQVLRVLLDVGFWLGALALAGLLVMLFLPQTAALSTSAISAGLQFDGFRVNLPELNLSPTAFKLYGSVFWLVLALGLGSIWVLRAMVRSLRKSTPFTVANARRIEIIAGITLAGAYIRQFALCQFVTNYLAAHHPGSTEPLLTAHFNLLPTGVLWALCLLILARIFRYGVQLQLEHDQTV